MRNNKKGYTSLNADHAQRQAVRGKVLADKLAAILAESGETRLKFMDGDLTRLAGFHVSDTLLRGPEEETVEWFLVEHHKISLIWMDSYSVIIRNDVITTWKKPSKELIDKYVEPKKPQVVYDETDDDEPYTEADQIRLILKDEFQANLKSDFESLETHMDLSSEESLKKLVDALNADKFLNYKLNLADVKNAVTLFGYKMFNPATITVIAHK